MENTKENQTEDIFDEYKKYLASVSSFIKSIKIKQTFYIILVLVSLQVLITTIAVIHAIPFLDDFLALIGLFYTIKFSLSNLLKNSDRQAFIESFKEKIKDYM